MAKKETKKTSTNEVVEEVVETTYNEVEATEEITEETPAEETPVEEPVVEEASAPPVEEVAETEEEVFDWNRDYSGKFTPDEGGRTIELIVPDGMIGKVTMLLGEHDLILTLTADNKVTVGPFSGDKFNEAVRLVAGCGIMYRI
nr:MAG TPA: hypothetical protein [Caudoviricetes sp.]